MLDEIKEEWAFVLAAALALLAAVACINLEPAVLPIDSVALLLSFFFSCGCGDPLLFSLTLLCLDIVEVASGDLVCDRRALAALPRDDLPFNDPDEDKGDLTPSCLPKELELLLSTLAAVGSSTTGGERIGMLLGALEDGGERVFARELAVGFEGVPVSWGLSGIKVELLSFAKVEDGEVILDGEGRTFVCLALFWVLSVRGLERVGGVLIDEVRGGGDLVLVTTVDFAGVVEGVEGDTRAVLLRLCEVALGEACGDRKCV